MGYEEVTDILNRYRTLRESNQDLMNHVAQQDAQVDGLRAELYEFKSDKENQILVGNNLCQTQRELLDKIRKEVSSEEGGRILSRTGRRICREKSAKSLHLLRICFFDASRP